MSLVRGKSEVVQRLERLSYVKAICVFKVGWEVS